MRINHNIPALNAYRNLTMNTVLQGKSMEKLSSGLRINRAADDAAGLAISETMRSQIRGLNQAGRNAQDAISLIQTAEGALTETHSILQRMRELAVQAANDTYTSSDRLEIQKEVDQLKDEIDRIANTTTFNNKNLLNGTAGAITSTDKLTTKVFMRGGLRVVDEFGRKTAGAGNYKLTIAATAGESEIQKSNVFKNNHTGSTVQNLSIDINQGIEHISATTIAAGTYSIVTTANKLLGVSQNATATIAQSWQASNSTAALNAIVMSAGLVSTNVCTHNASILIEVANVVDIDGNGVASQITYDISWYEYNRSGAFLNSLGLYDVTGTPALKTMTITVSAATLNAATTALTIGSAMVLEVNWTETGTQVGDKIVINQLMQISAAFLGDQVNLTYSNGVNAATSQLSWWFNDDELDNRVTENLYFMSIETDGTARDTGHIDLDIDGIDSSITASSTFVFGEGMGKVASLDTQLKDIDKFYDVNGKFLLDDPQKLTLVQGDGTRAQIVLYGTDSVRDVVQKLNDAIADQLGQGDLVGSGDVDRFVSYVTNADANGFETVEGTMLIRSAKAGADGEINVIGNEGLINALGLANVQDATESTFTINVTNAHDITDIIASGVEIQGNVLIGTVHQNVDVKFDSNADIVSTWNATTKKFDLTGDATRVYTTTVHLVDNTQVFQIGANEMQDMGSAIGDMKSEALGVNNILVTDRESAGRAITKLDSAIGLVSSQRASLGAVQNRLEHTINNLGVAEENLTASESRIRDADMAAEMMQFSKLNILSQAATAMLAQANQLPQQVLQLIGR